MKRGLKTALRLILLGSTGIAACAAMPDGQLSEGEPKEAGQPAIAIGKASFRIPFTIDAHGSRPSKVQLWVSTDAGKNWQMHGSSLPDANGFDFRAAAQGEYLFLVQSVDEAGVAYPSNAPPMRVLVDTESPRVDLVANLTEVGQLAVDLKIDDPNLNLQTAQLRLRTNRDSQWRDVPTDQIAIVPGQPGSYRLKQVADVESCREVAIVFRIEDTAGNAGEATYKYEMPRTASLPDLTLASTEADGSHLPTAEQSGSRRRFESMPGATSWAPAKPKTREIAAGNRASKPVSKGPGQLAGAAGGLSLDLPDDSISGLQPSSQDSDVTSTVMSPYGGANLRASGATESSEELPLPPALQPESGRSEQFVDTRPSRFAPSSLAPGGEPPRQDYAAQRSGGQDAVATNSENPERYEPTTTRQNSDVFQCNTRTFSLDYSVESLGGSSLSDVQLWGTEDGGAHWALWGTDPDRVSPFDVKVGNDGTFGFRMVIVGTNGVVSNRPRFGDKPDVELEVDTEKPAAQITRAVYGKGTAEGQLVVDYHCKDPRLVQHPVSLHFRTTKHAPWQQIDSGLAASDTYLWQPPRDLPDQIYLKVEAVDRAGNIGSYELVDPIDIKGLAPRGRIHRVRPIR